MAFEALGTRAVVHSNFSESNNALQLVEEEELFVPTLIRSLPIDFNILFYTVMVDVN